MPSVSKATLLESDASATQPAEYNKIQINKNTIKLLNLNNSTDPVALHSPAFAEGIAPLSCFSNGGVAGVRELGHLNEIKKEIKLSKYLNTISE